MPQTEQS